MQNFSSKKPVTQNFQKDLKTALKAEYAIEEWLISKKYHDVHHVNEKGHDIICKSHNGVAHKVEVKRDFWTEGSQKHAPTNNICIEIWSHFYIGNYGWIKYSDATEIFYLCNDNLYVIDFSKLQKYIFTIIDFGRPSKTEPKLKKSVQGCRIADAEKNGNPNVRNLYINKQILIREGIITKILNRNKSGIDEFANKYAI